MQISRKNIKGKIQVAGMKSFLLILLMISAKESLFSQQDPMFSQYMFNGLVINPAYAGSRDALSTMMLFRKQWVGINGAPTTENISIHTPTRNRRNGFGLMVVNDKISYIGQTWIHGSYAYRMQLGKGKLAFGLQGSLYNYRINWSQAVTIDQVDPVTTNYAKSYWLPNAGFGVYYNTERFYVGASIPRLLINSLSSLNPSVSIFRSDSSHASLRRHVFLTAGYVFNLTPDVKFKPSFLVKYVEGAPIEFDINANFYFNNRFGVGASYRTGDGIVVMANFLATRQLQIGYAYDYPFSPLRSYTSGTHELMLAFDFFFQNDEVVSPRFF